MTIRVKILEIKPEVHYDDTTYEQTVVVELPDGKKMGLFDYDMHTTLDMIGDSKNLIILAFLPKQVEKLIEIKPMIEPSSDKPTDWKNHTFYGQIKEITTGEDKKIILDVGFGEIYVDPQIKEIIGERELKKDDYVKVLASRVDLLGIA